MSASSDIDVFETDLSDQFEDLDKSTQDNAEAPSVLTVVSNPACPD